METYFFAYCPLSYDGDFYPEAPPGCEPVPLFQASPGLFLCLCNITDHLQLDAEFETVRPYLVSEPLHHLLTSGLRWPPALALARLRCHDWHLEHLGLSDFEQRMIPLLRQCLERQNRIPAKFIMARNSTTDLNRDQYYWVMQGDQDSQRVRWVTSDYRMCEGPSDLFHWPTSFGHAKEEKGEPSSTT